VVVGPSGVGKGTVLDALRAAYPVVWLSVSVTTRAPRPGEVDGEDYYYITDAEFDDLVARDGLLEWAAYATARYGTPRAAVERHIAAGRAVIMELEIQGLRQVVARMTPVRTVFLAPPSWEELERRLRGRRTESEAAIERRLATARTELAAMGEADTVIVNREVAGAVAELVDLIGLADTGGRAHH